ncbi:two-component system response regulator [Arenicella chitinivorans]|uniref:Two-component system response regulator n=1 Tax=Arenicella chitinivorans TaxID=1329800 RepID=A0A918VGH4_9GAMM|nr:response regulator [Arenicella chitinivorans]GGZ95958.1 two-component system response regulator [Arenicella chitinivorans]
MSKASKQFTILCVDDEPRITSALKALFRREYNVLIANSGQEALEILADNHVNVLVSDQRMPGMLGSELLTEVSRAYPQTIRILLTGFMDRQAIVDSINEGEVYRFINKPWDNFEIKEVVAEAATASELPAGTVFLGDGTVVEGGEDDAFISATRGKAIVLIEQNQDVRNQIRRFCTQREIMVYSTQNVEQAITAATTRDNVGVVIVELTDQQETLHTINLLKQARPELVTITLTHEYDANTAVDLINQGQVFKYLASPICSEELYAAIDKAFRRHLYLKDNSASWRRYKVDKPQGVIAAGLQSIFGRLLGAG